MSLNPSTPLWQLTVGEFQELLQNNKITEPETTVIDYTQKNYKTGLKGICEIFGCSVSKAQELKRSGVIDDAIVQTGRKIVTDVDLALKLVKENQLKR